MYTADVAQVTSIGMSGRLTLHRHITDFLADRKALGVYNAKSVSVVGPRLQTLSIHFGARPLNRLTAAAITSWMASLDHLAPASKASYFASCRQFCRWATTNRRIDSDPTAGMKSPKRPVAVPRAQPSQVIAAILAACLDDRDRLIVHLMVDLGLRRGEVAAARWELYDPISEIITVRGKGGKERELPVTDEVSALMRRQHRRAHGPVISSLSKPGTPLTPERVGRIVLDIMRRAGVKQAPYDGVSGHALRHTAASDVLDHCHDVRIVQAMLGHAHLSSTSIYLRRASLGQMREAMEGRHYGAAAS